MPDICFWNKCNNRCVMCTNPREFSLSTPLKNYDLKTQILKFKSYLSGNKVYESNKERRDYINITGGEPTLHPNFFELLYYIRKNSLNIPITLLTNGRKFSNKKFLNKFISIARQPFKIAIALHSSKKELFEKITGVKGSFNQTVKALDNLKGSFKGEIEIRIVLHKLNIYNLREILDFIAERWGYGIKIVIIHYEIEGMSEINIKNLDLSLSESAKEILKSLKSLKKFHFNLYHYPLCVLDKKLRPYAMITLPKEDRVYTKICGDCKMKAKCLGLMREYYKIYGDGEIRGIDE